MKRILFSIAIIFVFASNAYAQTPVTDSASIAKQVENQAETIAQWRKQYSQMSDQISQMQKQYDALTGSRNLGSIMNNPEYRNYLPTDWQQVYDKERSSGYAGLSGSAESEYDANKIFDSCAAIQIQDEKTACEAQAVKGAQDKQLALDAYKKSQARIDQIDKLMGKINETKDPKAISELQARIAIEQANIQNEQTKLQMVTMVAAAEDRVQQQRQHEIEARTWSSRKGIEVQPIHFDKP